MRKVLILLFFYFSFTAEGQVLQTNFYRGRPSALLTGLVSAYDFEEASGTLVDLVGSNDFDDIQSTPTYHTTGKIAYGIDFNSASDGINLMTGGFNTTTAASLSLWIRFNQLPTTTGDIQFIFRNSNSASPWYSFILDLEADNTWLFAVHDNASSDFVVAHSAPTTGTWYHVACVAEVGAPVRIYINNVKTNGSQTLLNNILSTDEQSCIGNAYQADTHAAMAIIDMPRWWNIALTDALVNELYTKENAGTTYPW